MTRRIKKAKKGGEMKCFTMIAHTSEMKGIHSVIKEFAWLKPKRLQKESGQSSLGEPLYFLLHVHLVLVLHSPDLI